MWKLWRDARCEKAALKILGRLLSPEILKPDMSRKALCKVSISVNHICAGKRYAVRRQFDAWTQIKIDGNIRQHRPAAAAGVWQGISLAEACIREIILNPYCSWYRAKLPSRAINENGRKMPMSARQQPIKSVGNQRKIAHHHGYLNMSISALWEWFIMLAPLSGANVNQRNDVAINVQ